VGVSRRSVMRSLLAASKPHRDLRMDESIHSFIRSLTRSFPFSAGSEFLPAGARSHRYSPEPFENLLFFKLWKEDGFSSKEIHPCSLFQLSYRLIRSESTTFQTQIIGQSPEYPTMFATSALKTSENIESQVSLAAELSQNSKNYFSIG
jgi:hypothetical protein